METISKQQFCFNCGHAHYLHDPTKDDACKVTGCDCESYLDEEALYEDLNENGINLEDTEIEDLGNLLKGIYYFVYRQKESLKLVMDCFDERYAKPSYSADPKSFDNAMYLGFSNISECFGGIEKSVAIIAAFLNIDLPDSDSIIFETKEMIEFQKLLSLPDLREENKNK